MTDLMETLHKLDTIEEGAETMITFGPKIQVILEKVYEGRRLQYVSASTPKTLKEAITTAINIERVRKTSGKGKGTSTTPVARQFNAAWNPDAKNDPMEDVQVNDAQQGSSKKSNKKKAKAKKDSSTTSCKVQYVGSPNIP